MSNQTNNVSFPNAIRTAIAHYMSHNLNVCLPAQIVRVIDFKKRKISVLPEIKREFLDGDTLEPSVIENVPLLFTGSSEAVLKFPIKVGDKVILVFSHRSLDNWLTKGERTTPGSRRKFDISDAFAIPAVQAFNSDHIHIDNNEDTELIFDGKKIKLIKDGSLQIDTTTNKVVINNAVEDLAKLIDDLLAEIIAIKTIGSPTNHVLDPTTIANFTAIKTRFTSLLKES